MMIYAISHIKELISSPAYWNSFNPDAINIRKNVTEWFEHQYGSVDTTKTTIKPFYFANRTKIGKTLFLGEGNLSFALSIATLPDTTASNVVATTYEKEKEIIDYTKKNADLLIKLGSTIQFGIDATHLEKYNGIKFKTIIFQFPHTGSREPLYGHNPNFILIRRFLKNAKNCLDQNGQIIISTVDNPHYRGAFQFEEAAKETGYNEPETFNFDPTEFPEYTHINTNDDESAIDNHKRFSTWIFTIKIIR